MSDLTSSEMSSAEKALNGLNVSDTVVPEESDAAQRAALAAKRKAAKDEKKRAKAAKAAQKKAAPKPNAAGSKSGNRDGMEVGKMEDFGAWYSQLMTKSELIDFYDISGCYILRPWSFSIWESIREFFDAEIKKLGVLNCSFPLFVTKKRLETEEDHVEGFAAEVAWVTKSGQSDLEEPIAVRPTSETIIYPSYSKWIRSHRDLPLKLNQWSNVVRWEFKYPTPFIRSREFLWQEGHTAFETKEEAGEEVLTILELYRRVYEELLAVPVIMGRKSEKEKFAGGLYTTTVEGFNPANGRAIQGATSHCLGQNFSKMFQIDFEKGNEGRQFVWQNSWGISTRSIGVMAMVHGDDKGLVLPPRAAPLQVVIVPILQKGQEEAIMEASKMLEEELRLGGIRVKADVRDDKNPGWKFNYWELKGVPLRLELGPRDLKEGVVMGTRRSDGGKIKYDRAGVVEEVKKTFVEIQKMMIEKARCERDEKIVQVDTWEEFMFALEKRTMILAAWCEGTECEEDVKTRSTKDSLARMEEEEVDERALSGAAKTLCIPFKEELNRLGISELTEGTQCYACEKKAVSHTLWGRSY